MLAERIRANFRIIWVRVGNREDKTAACWGEQRGEKL